MILITGASSGIGEACARTFAREGRELFLVARRGERLQSLRQELSKLGSPEVKTSVLDVSNRMDVEAWAEENAEALASVAVLINNAGLAKGLSSIQDGELDDWDAMIDTNLKGLLYVTRLVLPHLKGKPRAQIVNIGSVAGKWVYPKGNVYCATKHAVHALTEALRQDLLGSGIRVTEICPGMVETEFSRVRLGDVGKAKAVYSGMTPLTAQDIADSVSWCINRPVHVNIQELVIYPTDQASPTLVNRR